MERAAGIVGPEHVLTGEAAARWSVSGVQPAAVVAPADREEAARVIDYARSRGWVVVPYGGGTLIDFGNAPRRLDLVVSTARLNRVVDYQPDDMTITVEPGITLAGVAQALSARKQFLPLNPARPERATVGGTVAAAASGPWRAGHGTPRDWVIGCRVLGADGLEVRGGGQVVKNVAGYDLPKLYTGSYGTLGLITEVTFKVMPHPGAEGYSRVELTSAEATEALLARMMDSDLQPSAVELLHTVAAGKPHWSLLCGFIHVHEAIDWQRARLEELAAEVGGTWKPLELGAGAKLLATARDQPAKSPFAARISTVSSRVAELARTAGELALRHGQEPFVRAHAVTGQLYVLADEQVPEALANELRAAAAAAGGTCVFPRLPAPLRGRIDPWGPVGTEVKLFRAIKETLDPTGVFSPGRFVGGI